MNETILKELKEFEITEEDVHTMISSLMCSNVYAPGSKNGLLLQKLFRYLTVSRWVKNAKIKCVAE